MDNAVTESDESLKLVGKAILDATRWFDKRTFEPDDSILYHYTSPEGLIGIVSREGIILWFSKYNCVNDKAEGRFIYKLFTNEMYALFKKGDISDDFYKKVSDGYASDDDFDFLTDEPRSIDFYSLSTKILPPDPDYYICCFSKNMDSLPMWNYYTKGNNCRGYNIGLLTRVLKENIDGQANTKMKLRSVIYDKTDQSDLIKELIRLAYKSWDILGENYTRVMIKYYLDEWRLIFKPQCFAHEEEVRLILKRQVIDTGNDILDTNKQKFRSNSGYVIPFIELIFPSSILASVSSGPLLDMESFQNGVGSLLHCRGYKGITLRTSKVPVRY